jgi:hypothetical protein
MILFQISGITTGNMDERVQEYNSKIVVETSHANAHCLVHGIFQSFILHDVFIKGMYHLCNAWHGHFRFLLLAMQSGGGGGCQCRYYLDMYHSFHEMVGSLL